jgi:hypothetical protein
MPEPRVCSACPAIGPLLESAGMIRSLGLILLASASFAAELPDEFAITDSIVMTDADEFYISPTVSYFPLPDKQPLTIATELSYGFTDRLQMRVEVPYEFVHSNNGFGDVETSVRDAIVDYRNHPFGLDAGLGVVTPTGNRHRDLGEGRWAAAPFFTATQWFGPVHAQLNFAWQRAVDHAGNDFEYNVALVYPIRQWFVVVEANGETEGGHTKDYVTPELVWKVTEHFELRLAVPVGVTHAAGDYGVIGGCTVEFEKFFHRHG